MPNMHNENAITFLEVWTSSMRGMMNGYARLLAPDQLTQPILPGWNVGNTYFVSNENSRDPNMERRILAGNSYGRQLGRIMDALTVLVNQQPEATRTEDGPLKEFLRLASEIQAIKESTRAQRVDDIKASLESLRKQCPREFEELMCEFRNK